MSNTKSDKTTQDLLEETLGKIFQEMMEMEMAKRIKLGKQRVKEIRMKLVKK